MSAAAESYVQLAALHAEENAKSFDEVEADKARRADRRDRDVEYDQQQGIERDYVSRVVCVCGRGWGWGVMGWTCVFGHRHPLSLVSNCCRCCRSRARWCAWLTAPKRPAPAVMLRLPAGARGLSPPVPHPAPPRPHPSPSLAAFCPSPNTGSTVLFACSFLNANLSPAPSATGRARPARQSTPPPARPPAAQRRRPCWAGAAAPAGGP